MVGALCIVNILNDFFFVVSHRDIRFHPKLGVGSRIPLVVGLSFGQKSSLGMALGNFPVEKISLESYRCM